LSKLYYQSIFYKKIAQAIQFSAKNVLSPFKDYLNIAIEEQKKRRVYAKWEKANSYYYTITPRYTKVFFQTKSSIKIRLHNWYLIDDPDINLNFPIFSSSAVTYTILKKIELESSFIVQLDKAPNYNDELNCGIKRINLKSINQVLNISQNNTFIHILYVSHLDNGFFNIEYDGAIIEKSNKIIVNDHIPIDICEFESEQINNIIVDGKKVDILKVENNLYFLSCVVKKNSNLFINNEETNFKIDLNSIPSELYIGSNKFTVSIENDYFSINGIEISKEDIVYDENGLSYVLKPLYIKEKDSIWVKLIDDENDDDELQNTSKLDFFFEDGVDRVEDGNDYKKSFQIVKRDKEGLKLLLRSNEYRKRISYEDLPNKLYLPIEIYQLKKQLEAITNLLTKPLYEHKNLISLTEKADKYEWKNFTPQPINDWYVLTTNTEGTINQRNFVEKAISTPDFAFLEGPPGSGKTTAILELILQLLKNQKRILLSASTHVAIDNVLEKLFETDYGVNVFPIRIGDEDNVYKEELKKYVISNQIPKNSEFEDIILSSANLVCGTTIGILQHPHFKRNRQNDNAPIDADFDYLIIDESSKTTFQEFLVPALRAKKWILVGDIKQLSPYTDQKNLIDNFNMKIGLNNGNANLIINQYLKPSYRDQKKCCLVLTDADYESLKEEVNLRVNNKEKCDFKNTFIFLEKNQSNNEFYCLSIDDCIGMKRNSFYLLGIDILFVRSSQYEQVKEFIPSHLFIYTNIKGFDLKYNLFKTNHFYNKEEHEANNKANEEFLESTWGREIVWRMTRNFESRYASKDNKYKDDIHYLLPEKNKETILSFYKTMYRIALPSILEILQKGIGKEQRDIYDNVLNSGFPTEKFIQRFERLEYQHRMHPDISKYSRSLFYDNQALVDSKTC